MHLPPGIAAMLSSVELCAEAQAAASACPAGSEVGQADRGRRVWGRNRMCRKAGGCSSPGPYGGAPFGLEIVTPAKAGPVRPGLRDGPLEARISTRTTRR